jgi:DNA polymerase I-like protein with 3'-5' exonuclease and polymerase domains
MRFDEPGLFYIPEIYRREKPTKTDKAPRVLPPIPETGWTAKEEFPDLSRAKIIGIDTETYDPDLKEKGPGPRRDGYIVGVSVSADGNWSRYFPVAHSMGQNLNKEKVFAWLKEQLRGPQLKVGANLMYDLDFLHYEGVHVGGRFYDVCWADVLIDEHQWSYSLESISRRRLAGEGKETSLLYQWCADAYGGKPDDSQRANIWRTPAELVGPYAEADASLPPSIMRAQIPLLTAMDQIEIARLEFGLIPLLLRMRWNGVRIDLPKCQQLDDDLTVEIDRLQKEIGVNVYAGDELAALCQREGIDYVKTDAGNPSFVKAWLETHPHPTMQKVAGLRKVRKLRDVFVRGHLLGSHINGRVHCILHPLRSDEYGTVSGRFSATDPNLQQISARDKVWSPRVRGAFLPEEGEVWGKNDMSQIEFRLGVHFGKGNVAPVREEYINNHKVSFYKIAAALTGLEYTPAKSLSLGTLYGMGLDKFAEMTGLPIDEARRIFNTFNRRLPFMRDTNQWWAKYAEENASETSDGWVRTIGGRLCHLPKGQEHKALNRLLQGSCADWIKQAMLDAYEDGVFDVLTLLLTVHDELDDSIPRTREGFEAIKELHHIMVNTFSLNVPVLVGMDLGPNWGTLEEFDEFDSPSVLRCLGLPAA